MPIYSNLYSNLARQGFAKSVTHGYAQSVVAATHPQVYASQNRPGFGLQRRTSKLATHTHHTFKNAFHTSAQSNSITELRPERTDSGLDAYFEAWRNQHPAGEPEPEWTQFQFAKRIEWTPQAEAAEAAAAEHLELAEPQDFSRQPLETDSTVLEDIKNVELGVDEEAALAQIDAAIEKEIKARSDQAIFEAELSVVASRTVTPTRDAQSPILPAEESFVRTPKIAASSTADLQSQSYAEHLTKLSEAGRYAEIPAVFEAMLVAGIQPVANAYNALLNAAVHLPADRVQVVPKALDVYSDMMRRKVLPNTATYDTLINLVASRSVEVSLLKQMLEERRLRFGIRDSGKFMLASTELEFAILAEEDRLDVALRLFDAATAVRTDRAFSAETYHELISACSQASRVPDMIRLYEHMEMHKVVPLASTFAPMIQGFNAVGDSTSAVECYKEYKELAIADNEGEILLEDRQDANVYAALIKGYITSDRVAVADDFFTKIAASLPTDSATFKESIISAGFVEGMLASGMLPDAFAWADSLEGSHKIAAMSKIAAAAADKRDHVIANMAFSNLPLDFQGIATPAMAMLALSVRVDDVIAAQRYFDILSHPEIQVTSEFIEPTVMFAVSMIGSGHIAEGLMASEQMFSRIKANAAQLADEVEEGAEFISSFMKKNNLTDPRKAAPEVFHATFTPAPYAAPPPYEDNFDPYAASTDFKGSSLIADELERSTGGRNKVSRLGEALGRFKNMRRAGRHPRYITYAKLISAAAKEEKMDLVHDILGMARSDVPLLPQHAVVRYGWASILDAMVGACLTLGNRALAAQYHQELLDIGAAPSANTFGLYITTLKESTKTFDEASEAVKIFHRAQSEGVEPSSFLYNALIGKLGKARRIDDCLFYFGEMRAQGIRPTSVTYGTIVNALCRVSDEKFAEELFEEMESMPNYKARPAPYNSLMQFFLTTKRDKSKVLAYYERMQSKGIQPTNHTYKLLVDTHATLEPINMSAAEAVLDVIRSTGQKPEAVHYSSLIHAKGCVLHDMAGAREIFDSVLADPSIRPQACLYQALFEGMVANHHVAATEPLLASMATRRVDMTPYIANTLIHGWANESNIAMAKEVFARLGHDKREPSTYEAMARAYLAVEDREGAQGAVTEMLRRGYPAAVSNKILELLGGGKMEV